MAICAECGSVVPDTKKFCPGCGARIDSDDGRFSATMLDQDGNRVVVQSRRAQQQRRTLVPFDENKPVLNARSSRGQTKIAANRPNQVRKEATDIDGLLFDDDEYETVRQDRVAKRDSARLVSAQNEKMHAKQQIKRPAGRPAVLGVVDYLLSMILVLIPLLGLMLGILWACGASNPNKRNFGKAAIMLQSAALFIGGVVFILTRWVFKG